jgi:hypothetical protein
VLTLGADGTLRSWDAGTGEETAATALLAEPPPGDGGDGRDGAEPRPGPVIELDASRAYVNDPAAGVVHEIDYHDALRVARTFTLDITPDLMVETGR